MQPGKTMLSGNHLHLAVISDPLIACFMDMCTSMKDLEGRFLHQVIQRGKQLCKILSFVRSACLGGQRLSAQRMNIYMKFIHTSALPIPDCGCAATVSWPRAGGSKGLVEEIASPITGTST